MMKKTFQFLFDATVILDANIIIDLFQLDVFHLPKRIFSVVFISENIMREELYDNDIKCLIDLHEYKPINITANSGYEKFYELKSKHKKLSTPDIVLICSAFQHGLYCITNDKRIRKACDELKIETSGTLGILGCAYENDIITKSELDELIKKYRKINVRLDIKIVDDFYKSIKSI